MSIDLLFMPAVKAAALIRTRKLTTSCNRSPSIRGATERALSIGSQALPN
jgi:hypothetical protein